MTQLATQAPDHLDAAHESLVQRGIDSPLNTLRRSGFAAFKRLGFPTTAHEDWRYTSLKSLASATFRLSDEPVNLTSADIAPFAITDLQTITFVFVNGHFAPALSDPWPDGAGVKVQPLTEALADPHGPAATKLGKLLDIQHDAFAALNTAFIADGLFVHLAPGQSIETPLHILSITTTAQEPLMTHPRCLIVAEDGASLSIIEQYVSIGEQMHMTNAVTEIHAGDRARVHHYFIERENESAFNISTLKIHQGRQSDVHSHTALLGGRLVRNNVHPILAGDDGHCLINGLYIGRSEQHLDNHMRVEHAALRGDSRQFYKGILDDRSHGVFAGRIVVHPGAQQTDAKQTNRNMLLSDEARINAKPQLEIYADDVKCTHGATTGQVDEDMVFYLRSRGIDARTARAMMIFAFAAETFERIELDAVRQLLKRELLKRLPEAEVLADVL